MGLVPTAVESSRVAEGGGSRGGAGVRWLVVGCYLLAAVVVTWRLWVDPRGRAPVGDTPDVDLFVWFLRYSAAAVAHGRLPALVTTAMNAPRGINMMWNTSFLLPGVVLAPVTLLAGPQVSLLVVLTAGFAGSAASMFWVLGRWGAGAGAAALGGALYGFSPALVDSAIGHYNLAFAVGPPLIIDALLRVVTGRSGVVRGGLWLGLLVAAQLFTGEELLADTAVAGMLLLVMLAAGHRDVVRERVRGAAAGLAAGAGVVLALCGWALWVQLRGPLAQHGTWEGVGTFTNHLGFFVGPPGTLVFHTRASAAAAANGANKLPEYLAYLGWPLIVVLVAAAVRYWRDARVRAFAVTWAVLELFSLGGQSRSFAGVVFPGGLLPWHWLQGLPVVGAILPDRFSILADGAAAAVLAFSLDLARSAAPRAASWQRRNVPAAVAVLALLPLIPLPVQAGAVSRVPAGWQATFSRLELTPRARVLLVPVPYSHQPEPILWQADTGQPGSFIGGWFVGPTQTGQATVEFFGPHRITILALYLDTLWARPSRAGPPPSPRQVRADLAYLRPAAVVAVTSPHTPLGRYLTRLFGKPAFETGQVTAWRR